MPPSRVCRIAMGLAGLGVIWGMTVPLAAAAVEPKEPAAPVLRVGVRGGTVSEVLLQELNAGTSAPKVSIVPLAGIRSGMDQLLSGRLDALLGDTLQLRYLLGRAPLQGARPTLALQGIRPESQAFVFSPGLPEATAERIDRAISVLKRNGVVSSLRQQATEPAGTSGR
jgi:ABC-type amino acid transport substrate-binding protein